MIVSKTPIDESQLSRIYKYEPKRYSTMDEFSQAGFFAVHTSGALSTPFSICLSMNMIGAQLPMMMFHFRRSPRDGKIKIPKLTIQIDPDKIFVPDSVTQPISLRDTNLSQNASIVTRSSYCLLRRWNEEPVYPSKNEDPAVAFVKNHSKYTRYGGGYEFSFLPLEAHWALCEVENRNFFSLPYLSQCVIVARMAHCKGCLRCITTAAQRVNDAKVDKKKGDHFVSFVGTFHTKTVDMVQDTIREKAFEEDILKKTKVLYATAIEHLMKKDVRTLSYVLNTFENETFWTTAKNGIDENEDEHNMASADSNRIDGGRFEVGDVVTAPYPQIARRNEPEERVDEPPEEVPSVDGVLPPMDHSLQHDEEGVEGEGKKGREGVERGERERIEEGGEKQEEESEARRMRVHNETIPLVVHHDIREVEDNQNINSNGPISEVLGSETVEMETENHSTSTVVKEETMEKEQECEEMEPEIISNQTVANLTIMEPNQEDAPKPTISEVLSSETAEIVNSNSVVMKLEIREEDENCVQMVPPNGEMSEPVVIEIKIENQLNAADANLEIEEDDRDIVEMVAPKREESLHVPDGIQVNVNDQLNVAEANLNHETVQCRVCDDYFNKNWMTEIPTDPNVLRKWIGVLGSEFFGKIIQNSPPYFICMSHLRLIVDKVFEEEQPTAEL